MNNPQQILLTPVQLALRDALTARDEKLGNMYYGALLALTLEANPERFSQCAQSLRELMEKLAYVQSDVKLGTKVKELIEKWDRCKNAGGIENSNAMKILAGEMDIFSVWVQENRPSRRDQAQKILDDLDPMFMTLPSALIEAQSKAWSEDRKYFENVAHHNHYPSEGEFRSEVEEFSGFLLNLLRPKTSDNFAEIQKLIQEGEIDAR